MRRVLLSPPCLAPVLFRKMLLPAEQAPWTRRDLAVPRGQGQSQRSSVLPRGWAIDACGSHAEVHAQGLGLSGGTAHSPHHLS